MSETSLDLNSLVLYRGRPARVVAIGDKKIEIALEETESASVRPKDVSILHPGPLESLDQLEPLEGEIRVAWELLAGSDTNLKELAELIYGASTPASAWAAWQLVADGLYFSGQPEEIRAHTPEEVAEEKAARQAREAEAQAWAAFLSRVDEGAYQPEDQRYLEEVVALAYGQREQSRVMRALGLSESPESAHGLLLRLGYWDYSVNPYPLRAGLPTTVPQVTLPELPDEPRRDLTHLLSLAIDDEGSRDPDDALSLENGRLWVHIADVAALIEVDSPADVEARARGANLYLPEGTVPMLPPETTSRLGLGLSDTSPALSFGLDLADGGEVQGLEIVPSWIRVSRLTYEEAESRLNESPLAELYQLARRHEARRRQNDAVFIDLPEVKIRVHGDSVDIRPLPSLRSRDLVREAMLLAGEAVAGYALAHEIPLPFTVQDPPMNGLAATDTPAQMFAFRRTLRPGQQTSTPGPHAGLGLDLYAQSTSPLRRYLDLVVHQQLRAHLRSQGLLNEQAVMARVGAADAVTGSIRWAERRSNTHWTLVYLLQHPGWQGQGLIVDRRGNHHVVLIPALGLETQIYLRQELPLDSLVGLTLTDVRLPELEAFFRLSQ